MRFASRLSTGNAAVMDAVRAEEELSAAELELASTPAERAKIVGSLVERLKSHEITALAQVKTGVINDSDQAAAKAARLKAEIELEKLKASR